MYKVYLAGFMSGRNLQKCTSWRIKIREHYSKMGWDIDFLDPFNGKEVATITKDGLKSSVPPKALFDRDYDAVQSANIIIANMDNFGEKRFPLGTLCEIVIAWTLKKPIILISKEQTIIEHPFIKEFASWIVPDVDTLLKDKILNYFFKGVHSAVYTEYDIKEIK